MRQGSVAALWLSVALLGGAMTAPAQAADPSLHEIYQAAESGHLDQAQAMIGTVLADHPNSAKAHFVAAELDARQGRMTGARDQLATAEHLAPGLPFAKPEAVSNLRAELGGGSTQASFAQARAPNHGIPWMPIALGAMLIGLLLLWRNARRPPVYPTAWPPSSGNSPTYSAPYPSVPPSSGGGLGSTLGTGLAGGLAAGAGIVAGEALMNRLLNGGGRERDLIVQQNNTDLADFDDRRGSGDLGGQDFGVNDASSWDDDSAQSGSDDWG